MTHTPMERIILEGCLLIAAGFLIPAACFAIFDLLRIASGRWKKKR